MSTPLDSLPPFDESPRNPSESPDLLSVFVASERRDDGTGRPVEASAPATVDLVLHGQCQLRCEYCWGPRHDIRAGMTDVQVQALVRALAAAGVRHVVCTGGETTLSRLLPGVLWEATNVGLRTTLSTNGLRLPRHIHLLPYVDDLGIALDGPDAQTHNAMRAGAEKHNGFEKALEAIRLAQTLRAEDFWRGELTVRTVIARPNVSVAARMPAALKAAGVNLDRIRLKIYQVEPIGPHITDVEFDRDWAVSDAEVFEIAARIRVDYPGLEVEAQCWRDTAGRYFLIGPDGDVTGTDMSADGLPVEPLFGNALTDLAGAIAAWRVHIERVRLRGLRTLPRVSLL